MNMFIALLLLMLTVNSLVFARRSSSSSEEEAMNLEEFFGRVLAAQHQLMSKVKESRSEGVMENKEKPKDMDLKDIYIGLVDLLIKSQQKKPSETTNNKLKQTSPAVCQMTNNKKFSETDIRKCQSNQIKIGNISPQILTEEDNNDRYNSNAKFGNSQQNNNNYTIRNPPDELQKKNINVTSFISLENTVGPIIEKNYTDNMATTQLQPYKNDNTRDEHLNTIKANISDVRQSVPIRDGENNNLQVQNHPEPEKFPLIPFIENIDADFAKLFRINPENSTRNVVTDKYYSTEANGKLMSEKRMLKTDSLQNKDDESSFKINKTVHQMSSILDIENKVELPCNHANAQTEEYDHKIAVPSALRSPIDDFHSTRFRFISSAQDDLQLDQWPEISTTPNKAPQISNDMHHIPRAHAKENSVGSQLLDPEKETLLQNVAVNLLQVLLDDCLPDELSTSSSIDQIISQPFYKAEVSSTNSKTSIPPLPYKLINSLSVAKKLTPARFIASSTEDHTLMFRPLINPDQENLFHENSVLFGSVKNELSGNTETDAHVNENDEKQSQAAFYFDDALSYDQHTAYCPLHSGPRFQSEEVIDTSTLEDTGENLDTFFSWERSSSGQSSSSESSSESRIFLVEQNLGRSNSIDESSSKRKGCSNENNSRETIFTSINSAETAINHGSKTISCNSISSSSEYKSVLLQYPSSESEQNFDNFQRRVKNKYSLHDHIRSNIDKSSNSQTSSSSDSSSSSSCSK